MMVKKTKKGVVPDWLNSPIIWSSSPTSQPQPPSPWEEEEEESRSVSPPPIHRTGDSSLKEPAAFLLPPKPPTVITHQPPPLKSQQQDIIIIREDDDDDRSTTTTSNSSSLEDVTRHAQLLQQVSKKMINLGELRMLASLGIPPAIRSTTWKLLLGYLPTDKRIWSSELSKKRSQYKHFKDDLLMHPSEITKNLQDSAYADQIIQGKGLLPRSKIPHDEHPLSLGKTSIWNQYFQDSEIIDQIDRDVKRTHPDIPFFSADSAFAKANRDSLKTILIIFAKLNPGIRYVQGMNEILAPLFYVFKTDPNEDYAANAETDAFFCFVELLSDFRDNFCQQLDNSIVGIRSTISRLSQLLKQHDEELWRHLEVTTKVNPQFYAFRWITLLLTQEFNFTDILHIWDMLLSNPVGPRETLLRICCAMLILVRRRLLAGDFTANLKLLQSYPSTNISHLLYVANKLNSHSAQ